MIWNHSYKEYTTRPKMYMMLKCAENLLYTFTSVQYKQKYTKVFPHTLIYNFINLLYIMHVWRLCKHKKQFKVFPIAQKSFSHFSKMYEAALQDIKYDPRGLFLKLLWIEPQWYSITWNWNFSDFQWNNFQSHGIEIEILFSSDQSLMIALSVNDSLVHSLMLLRLDWWSPGRWR